MSVRHVELDVDHDTLALAVDELRSAADRRRTVAEKASGELTAAKRADAKLDIRTGATHVVRTLGEADDLRALADLLHRAAAGLPRRRPAVEPSPVDPADASPPAAAVDDGTEPAPDEPPIPGDPRHDPDVVAMRALLGLPSTFDGDDVLDDDVTAAHAFITTPALDSDDAPTIPTAPV